MGATRFTLLGSKSFDDFEFEDFLDFILYVLDPVVDLEYICPRSLRDCGEIFLTRGSFFIVIFYCSPEAVAND